MGKETVIVGMSGGVDSSVSAALLCESGYEVIGLFMKNWEEDDTETYCAAKEDLSDAQAVCNKLGIELKTVNFSTEYWDRVFQYFLSEYRLGRTPNPDIVCNKEIKFKEFLKWAINLGADYIATGHYARVKRQQRLFQLLKGTDVRKDQSYFLHTLSQEALRYSMFPIGGMTKRDVRKAALKYDLPVHDKKDSTGICFIGERKFKDFLQRFLPARPGQIMSLDGTIIGEHEGAYYYTIGQRQGLGVGGEGDAWYVVDKDIKRNIVYAVQGHDHETLMSKVVYAEDLCWISNMPPSLPLYCAAKTRYRQIDQFCTVSLIGPNYTKVDFDQQQWAVTPGQSIVFYDEEVCIGGGVIQSTGQ